MKIGLARAWLLLHPANWRFMVPKAKERSSEEEDRWQRGQGVSRCCRNCHRYL